MYRSMGSFCCSFLVLSLVNVAGGIELFDYIRSGFRAAALLVCLPKGMDKGMSRPGAGEVAEGVGVDVTRELPRPERANR